MLATEILTQDHRLAIKLVEQLGEEIEAMKEEGSMSRTTNM